MQFRSFLNQLKKLQAVVGMPSGATGIMQRVTAKQAQTGTCIMVWYYAHICLLQVSWSLTSLFSTNMAISETMSITKQYLKVICNDFWLLK